MMKCFVSVEKVKVEGVGDRRDIEETGEFDVEPRICSSDPSKPSSPNKMDLNSSRQEDHIGCTKVENISEQREESEGLKEFQVRNVTNLIHPTQMHYFGIAKQEEEKEPADLEPSVHTDAEESELVCLSLATRSESKLRKEERAKNKYSDSCRYDKPEECLSLGLDRNLEGDNTSSTVQGKPWPPLTLDVHSSNKSNVQNSQNEENEVSPQPCNAKRARVSVRARCDAPTMSDGCQWRKYGQKIAKGNPCPRAYYRCTVAPGCPVRKQVQRCAEDLSILITTYEGTHNHPLPISATAMASTTSAAASMLMSGSSISSPSSTTISANLHGANTISMSNISATPSLQFCSPNLSIYSSTSHPTITLDLTAPNSSAVPQIKFPPSLISSNSKYSSSFNFSSSESNRHISYGAQPPHTKNETAAPLSLGRQPQDIFDLSHLANKMSTYSSASLPSQQVHNSLTDMIAGAITSHPSFQSAVASAIASYIGGAAQGISREGSSNDHLQRTHEQYLLEVAAAGNGFAPRYLTLSNSSSSKPQRQ